MDSDEWNYKYTPIQNCIHYLIHELVHKLIHELVH
jgi:hypothetical protein